MGRVPDNSALKRKQPDEKSPAPKLTGAELVLLDAIRSKKDMGMWTKDMKMQTKLPETIVTKTLKVLKLKNLIKEVPNIQNKGKKFYMSVEYDPSNELTGGAWYTDGALDSEFIRILKERCLMLVRRHKVATMEQILEGINKMGVVNGGCTIKQITEIMRALVLDNEVMEVRSTGIGDFVNIRVGILCYRCCNKAAVSQIGALASIPCGVCPRIRDCTPDGIISPINCVYYDKWLDF